MEHNSLSILQSSARKCDILYRSSGENDWVIIFSSNSRKLKTKLRGFGPRANYTDSLCQNEVLVWPEQKQCLFKLRGLKSDYHEISPYTFMAQCLIS
jgi:hypothetical protein